ncbi:anti-sigma factor [Subtercola endophyticus]|uniref:anti-sigma factor n=1 Tax=Subtercola endophyticus TaxID=2895559 RepID=UPI001E63AF75|nr:anti-sigma factor [Subtercola endophyticus]UFS59451.1 anti-sigma factor [Subtercola endophyticus]
MTRDDEYLSSGAYALNAMTADELRAFERALAESPELQRETDELSATATLLGLATAPVEPPASLKASLMAKLAETAQDAPASPRASTPSSVADTEQTETHEISAGEGASVPEYDIPSTPEIAPASANGSGSAAAKANARWFTKPMGVLVAAAAAVALFVGGGVVGNALTSSPPATSQDASASSLAQIFSAADVQSTHTSVEGGGQATVVWSNSVGSAAVVAQGMPSLPADKTYEAWYISGSSGVATPAGTFVPGGDATTWHVLSGSLTAGDTIGVTVEPAGGSQTPSTTPILAVSAA